MPKPIPQNSNISIRVLKNNTHPPDDPNSINQFMVP